MRAARNRERSGRGDQVIFEAAFAMAIVAWALNIIVNSRHAWHARYRALSPVSRAARTWRNSASRE